MTVAYTCGPAANEHTLVEHIYKLFFFKKHSFVAHDRYNRTVTFFKCNIDCMSNINLILVVFTENDEWWMKARVCEKWGVILSQRPRQIECMLCSCSEPAVTKRKCWFVPRRALPSWHDQAWAWWPTRTQVSCDLHFWGTYFELRVFGIFVVVMRGKIHTRIKSNCLRHCSKTLNFILSLGKVWPYYYHVSRQSSVINFGGLMLTFLWNTSPVLLNISMY